MLQLQSLGSSPPVVLVRGPDCFREVNVKDSYLRVCLANSFTSVDDCSERRGNDNSSDGRSIFLDCFEDSCSTHDSLNLSDTAQKRKPPFQDYATWIQQFLPYISSFEVIRACCMDNGIKRGV